MSVPVSEPVVQLPSHSSHDSARRMLRNSAINLIGYGFNAVFNLLCMCMLARCLGTEDFGYYYTVFTWMSFIQLITEAGVPTILTCRIIQDHGRWKEIVAEAGGLLLLVATTATLALLSVGAAWALWHGDAGPLVLFAAAAVACAAVHVQRFCAGVFQAYELFAYESLGKIVQAGLYMGAIAVLLVHKISSPGLAFIFFAASHVTVSLVMVCGLHWQFRCLGVRFGRGMVKEWLSKAGPLGAADVLRRVTWQIDTLLLALLQPAWVVGIYSVAWRPLAALNWVPNVVLSTTLPSFTRMAEHDPDSLHRAFAASLRYLWIASLPIAVAICIFAEPVVIVLAGRDFLEAAVPMRLLIWLTCLWFVSVPFRFYLTALGRARLYAALVVVGLVLVTVAETVLIPQFGYLGACSGSLFGEFALTAIGLVLCVRLGGNKIEWWAMVKAAFAAGIMGSLLWVGREASWGWIGPEVLGATFFYFLLCVALGSVRWQEIGALIGCGRSPETAPVKSQYEPVGVLDRQEDAGLVLDCGEFR